MKKIYFNQFLIAFTLSVLVIASCKKEKTDVEETPTNKNAEIIVNNNASTLANRVAYPSSDVAVLQINEKGIAVESREDFSQFNLQLIAEVAPPSYQGNTLQATHIDMVGTKVYVSYNTRGSVYLGGVDVFDVSNETHPTLVSQAIFPNTDVSSVVYSDNHIYLASATDIDKDGALTSPAVLDKVTLSGGLLSTSTARLQLKGYVGKNTLVKNGKIYTVSSSQGGLTVVNPSTFKQEKFIPVDYSRALASNASGSQIYVLKDEPGQILAFNSTDYSIPKTLALGGNLPETQANIEPMEVGGNVNFLYAGGRSGLNYLDPAGTLIDKIEVPASLVGLDPEDLVTNNLSINNGIIYIANGAAGLYVAKFENNSLVLLGKAALSGSSNFVKSNGNLIFVATGTGGLRILKLSPKTTSSSTVPCSGRGTLASNATGYRNLNSGTKEYFTGATVLGGLNVNDNSIFDFCGSLVLNYTSNINSNGSFLVNGSVLARQQLNINGFTEIVGSFTVDNTLTVNSNGKLKLIPTAASGEVYTIGDPNNGGDFNINGIAEVNNSTLKLNKKLSINSNGRLRLVNTNLIVTGDFDLNGTIEFVGTCNVTVQGKYTKNSSGKVIGTNTGKTL